MFPYKMFITLADQYDIIYISRIADVLAQNIMNHNTIKILLTLTKVGVASMWFENISFSPYTSIHRNITKQTHQKHAISRCGIPMSTQYKSQESKYSLSVFDFCEDIIRIPVLHQKRCKKTSCLRIMMQINVGILKRRQKYFLQFKSQLGIPFWFYSYERELIEHGNKLKSYKHVLCGA